MNKETTSFIQYVQLNNKIIKRYSEVPNKCVCVCVCGVGGGGGGSLLFFSGNLKTPLLIWSTAPPPPPPPVY